MKEFLKLFLAIQATTKKLPVGVFNITHFRRVSVTRNDAAGRGNPEFRKIIKSLMIIEYFYKRLEAITKASLTPPSLFPSLYLPPPLSV